MVQMSEHAAARNPIRAPTHPGEILREDVFPALGRNLTELAKVLHVSRQTLHAILREEAPVSPGMALKLGKLCGNGPHLWLNLQREYELHKLARVMERELEEIPTLEPA